MRTIYSLSILLMLITFSSCKDFLETAPSDSLSPDNYYQTEEHLNQALSAVYDVLATSPTYGGEMLGRLGLEADEGYHNRSAQKNGVYVYDVSAAEPTTAAFYKTFYDGINRANYLLANINKPTMDETRRGIIEGEALFLRAYYHFMLVQHFGDIPLRVKPTLSADEGEVVRTPAKEVYEQIIADMTKAEGLLASRTAAVVGKPGRINQSTVRGILARVCLHMAGYPVLDVSKYAEARKWAKLVMDTKFHRLNPSYSQVFINMCEDVYDVQESIWEVEFWGNGSTAYVELGRVGSNNGIQYTGTDPDIGYSYGFLSTTERHFFSYTPNDLRRDWTIAPFRWVGNGVGPVKTAWRPIDIVQRNSGKWRREYETAVPKAKNGGPINFPLLRYSDVLLMFAEADNYLTSKPSAEAIEAVNEVRRRAAARGIKTISVTNGGANYTTAPTVTINTVAGRPGTGAIAIAKIDPVSKTVTGIDMFSSGDLYTDVSDVQITLSGGGGTGATAVATALYTVADAELTEAQTNDKAAFLSMLQDERSRELGFECLRKMDLVRWGIFLDNMKRIASDYASPTSTVHATLKFGSLSYDNATERDVLWPIPVGDMGLNTNWIQNFGW